jgi:hypothetical protein
MCGSKQAVAIDSKPRAAEVLIYNANCDIVFRSTTPCTATLPRRIDATEKGHYVVLLKKEGFAPVQIPISGHVNSAYYLNIFNAGIGFLVDPATGSMWTLSPDPVENKDVKDKAGFFYDDGLFVSLKQQEAPIKVATPAPQKKTVPSSALTQASNQ